MAIDEELDRAVAMKKLAERSYGKFKTFMRGRIGGRMFNYDGEEVLQETEERLRQAVSELEEYNKTIGETLYFSVQADPNLQKAVFAQVLGDKEKPKEKNGNFQELKKAQIDDVSLQQDWKDFKAKYKYDSQDSSKQAELKDMFLSDQKGKYEEKNAKGGFWSRIMASLIEGLIDEKIDNLK